MIRVGFESPEAVDQQTKAMSIMYIINFYYHQTRFSTNYAPFDLLLHLPLKFLVGAVPAPFTLEREAQTMSPESAALAVSQTVVDLVII